MNQDIEIAKKIIAGTYQSDDLSYREIYMWTTENIRGMINQLDLLNKRILTVCSSGDHIFNFLLEGAEEVVAFDINPLTEYMFYLKRAAIINLEYEEFINFFFPKTLLFRQTFDKNIYNKIRKDIPNGIILEFWDELFTKYTSKELYNSKLFIKKSISNKSLIVCNKYLNNKNNYNILKTRLKTFEKLEFHKINIFEQIPTFKEKFDFVYLSNIIDSWHFFDKIEYLKRIKEIIIKISESIKEEGLIGVCYVYFYLDGYWSTKQKNNIPTLIENGAFNKKEYTIINFRSGQNLNSTKETDIDGVILTKKKRKNQQN